MNLKNGSFDGTDIMGNYKLQSAHGVDYFPVAAEDAPEIKNPDRSANFDGNSDKLAGSALFRQGDVRKNSHLETNDPDIYNLINRGSYTFECYFKRNAASTSDEWLFLTPQTVTQYGAWLQPDQIFKYADTGFKIEDHADSNTQQAFADSGNQPVGEWRHLALTREIYTDNGAEKSRYKLYINGTFVSQVEMNHKYNNATQCLRIGGRPDNANTWSGQLSSIRISNAVLEPSQFLCADNGAVAQETEKRTIVYWPMDNASGAADTTPAYGPSGFDLRAKTANGTSGSADQSNVALPLRETTLPRENSGSVVLAENAYMRSQYLGDWLSSEKSFTVEGWLKWDGATRGGEVTVFGLYDSQEGVASGRNGWKFCIDDTGDVPRFGIYARSAFGYTPMACGLFTKRAVTPDRWQHVALEYDPKQGARGVWTLYVNGKIAGEVENAWRDATHSASEQYFKFGRMFDVSAIGFSGALDMWRISSGLLSKEELLCYKIMGLVIKVM